MYTTNKVLAITFFLASFGITLPIAPLAADLEFRSPAAEPESGKLEITDVIPYLTVRDEEPSDLEARDYVDEFPDLDSRKVEDEFSDLDTRDVEGELSDLDTRDVEGEFSDELETRNLDDEDSELVTRSMEDDPSELEDRSVEDDSIELEARDMIDEDSNLEARSDGEDLSGLEARDVDDEPSTLEARNLDDEYSELEARSNDPYNGKYAPSADYRKQEVKNINKGLSPDGRNGKQVAKDAGVKYDGDSGKKEYLEGLNKGPLPDKCGKGCENSLFSKASKVCYFRPISHDTCN